MSARFGYQLTYSCNKAPKQSLMRSDLALLKFGEYCGALQNTEQYAWLP